MLFRSSVICTQFVPLANQSFYWYNGSVYYTFTFGLMLIMFSIYIGYYLYRRLWRIVLLCILSIMIGGSNYVTALLSSIIYLLIIIYNIIKKRKIWVVPVIPFLLLLVSFLISISAPGNDVRQSTNPVHPGAFQAIIMSFYYALKKIGRAHV